jgi:NAD(P) transhydrogenase
MSSSKNCLSGYYRALALRPQRGSLLATLKPCCPTSTLRSTPVFEHGDRSTHTLTATSLRSLTRPRPLSLQKHVSQVTAVARYASGQASEPHDEELPSTPPFTAGPYSNLTIGVPKESYPGERRVAITPQVMFPYIG